MSAISLFSNCGAGDVGYNAAGFEFEIMAELEHQRMEVCLLNHPGAVGIPGDLRETWRDVVVDWLLAHGPNERPALLCACPPCQGMSSARSGIGKATDLSDGTHDERNLLVEVVGHVIEWLKPRMVVLENVPQFLSRFVPHPETGEGIAAPRLLYERIHQHYHFFPIITDLADFGVPQSRKRAFITLIRRDEPCLDLLLQQGLTPYPIPAHAQQRVTFEQYFAAHPLPPLDSRWAHTAASPDDPLHRVSLIKDTDRRYAMMAATLRNGGSAWDNTLCEDGCNNSTEDVDPNAVHCPQCNAPLLRPIVKEEDGSYRLVKGFRSSSYRRMRLNDVASTITTASGHLGSDINIHPTQHRLLSVRECGMLQTFPQDFQWGSVLQKGAFNKIREMIGEAVPPLFTEQHGGILQQLLQGVIPDAGLLPATDRRHTAAVRKFEKRNQQLALELTDQAPAANDCAA